MKKRGLLIQKDARIGKRIKNIFALLFGAGIVSIVSGCMPALHAFYYKIPDNPQVSADVRDCQRTSLMSDVDQWAVMGSCLNTMPDVTWYYGIVRDRDCSDARIDGDTVGWKLYDCYVPSSSMEKMKGSQSDGNKQGTYLYNTMIEAMKARSGQKAAGVKSK